MKHGKLRPGRALSVYLSHYPDKNGGLHDLRYAFRLTADAYSCQRALYPGSYLHITPSLFFPEVCYVDSLKGIAQALSDPALMDYINRQKHYSEDAVVRCHEADYEHFDGEPSASFDLLVSLNAGPISQACRSFLKPGGLLLVNNSHYDAARAYLDPGYQLIGVFQNAGLDVPSSDSERLSYFRTAKGDPFTPAMLQANIQRPPSKARFPLAQEAEAYLFRTNARGK